VSHTASADFNCDTYIQTDVRALHDLCVYAHREPSSSGFLMVSCESVCLKSLGLFCFCFFFFPSLEQGEETHTHMPLTSVSFSVSLCCHHLHCELLGLQASPFIFLSVLQPRGGKPGRPESDRSSTVIWQLGTLARQFLSQSPGSLFYKKGS